MAWYSSASGHLGVLAQDVGADGSPVGARATMPDTSDMKIGMLGRTPLVARDGGGFYVAYPTGYPAQNRVRLWRIGASNAPLIARVAGSGSPAVAIAAAGDGRLWVLWTKGFGDPDVLATRSNRNATRFGAVVNAGHPKDAKQAYKLDASAAGGALDVLGNFNIGTTSTAVDLLPPDPARPDAAGQPAQAAEGRADRRALHGHSTPATPVKGARVRAGGESGTTGQATAA